MAGRLYGRTLEIEMVRELMYRRELMLPPKDAGRAVGDRQPVLVFEGGDATGKTALLDDLAHRCAGRVPYAYLDLERAETKLGDAAMPQLLAALASQLARRCKLYGSLRFNRLVIGLLAMELELNQVDYEQARSQVTEMLKNRQGLTTLKRVLRDVAQDALRLIPVPFTPPSSVVTLIVDWIFDTVASWVPSRRRRRFWDWYGHQGRDLGLDPIDELIGLNRSAGHHNQPDGGLSADELLLGAFLADLRDNFRTGRRADQLTLNCLLLLDNADTSLGRTFLHRLVQVYEYLRAGGRDLQTPVTVVATSRGGLLASLTRTERARVRDVAVVKDIRQLRQHDPGRISWLRHPLPPLTENVVHEMVKKLAPPAGNARNLAAMLHQLSGGHPGGIQLLLTAIASDRTTAVEPKELLGSKQAGATLENELYDRLLASVPEDAVDTLITCSAGRNRSEGLNLFNPDGAPDRAGLAVLPVGMWDPEAETHTALLRLLLLRRLARRPWNHEWNWSAAHGKLREASAQRGDSAGELHHALADDKVDEVTRALSRRLAGDRLTEDRLADWLTLLHAVTTAPGKPDELRAPGDGEGEQDDIRSANTADTDGPSDGTDPRPLAFVHTLVTKLREAADPMCGSNRSVLYWQIAGGYRELSTLINDSSEDLIELIQHYEQLAQQWQRGPRKSR